MTLLVPLAPNLILLSLLVYIILGSYIWGGEERGITHNEYLSLKDDMEEIKELILLLKDV